MNPQEKNTYVKQQITKALISLMKKKKITDISISEICDKAQVGRASFYRNYDAKEEVIEKHTEQLIMSWAESIEMDPNANIYNFFASLFEHFQKNSSFYKILYQQNMSSMILNAIRKKLNVNADADPAALYTSAFTAYGVFGWIDIWFSHGMKETPEELNRIIVSNINTMIKGAKALEEL
ncbi:MAG: TetR/AcrR family transcriptional regulator C-terminal domain-containing protein [Solobacterium sp.]|nr:TetR/AcrR family transcriptional regulator C-terminal domain-containing protein [Solobacterium sp.]